MPDPVPPETPPPLVAPPPGQQQSTAWVEPLATGTFDDLVDPDGFIVGSPVQAELDDGPEPDAGDDEGAA